MFDKQEEIIISWKWRYEDLNCRILDLATTLDQYNLEKLKLGFPDHVEALQRFWSDSKWFRSIEQRLKHRLPEENDPIETLTEKLVDPMTPEDLKPSIKAAMRRIRRNRKGFSR